MDRQLPVRPGLPHLGSDRPRLHFPDSQALWRLTQVLMHTSDYSDVDLLGDDHCDRTDHNLRSNRVGLAPHLVVCARVQPVRAGVLVPDLRHLQV